MLNDNRQLYVAQVKGTDKYITGFRRWILGNTAWWGQASEETRQENVDLIYDKFLTSDLNNADTYREDDLFFDAVGKYFDITFLKVHLQVS